MKKRRKAKKGRRSFQSFTLCISTAMVLVLVGIVVLSVMTAKNLSEYVKENFVITMTLEDDMTRPETQQLTKALAKKRYVRSLDFISKEQALKEQVEAMGTDPTEFIGANPFMASIELHLVADYANSDSLRWIQKEILNFPKISEITYQRDLMDSVNSNLRKISIVLIVLALLLTCISFTLINNTVRLGVYARRFNIHTMKLVGASWGFIRWPFVRQGLLVGLLSAIIADCILAACIYVMFTYEKNMETIVTWDVLITAGVTVLIFGLLLTWLCTQVSVNRFLRMKASQLYNI